MTDCTSGAARPGMLSLDELRQLAATGEIDTVILALHRHAGPAPGQAAVRRVLPGRGRARVLRGLQLPARRRRRHEHGRRLPDVVLGARLRRLRHAAGPGDAAPDPLASGHRAGAGRPDLAGRHAGGRVAAADPARGRSTGWPSAAWSALAGTELEFVVFADTYEQAAAKNYTDLVPANDYNVDYSILGTSRIEPLLRRIRNGMSGAGMYVESAKGECNLGQHEIAFRYADVLTTCDNHSIYKTGAKEIAAQDGMSITFMAKPNEREGNSCHIHLSLRGTRRHAGAGRGRPARPVGAGRALHGRPARRHARVHPAATRRTSTPTSGTCRAASRRRRSAGAWTTGPARSAWSGTVTRCGRRTGRRAAT